MYNIHVSVGVVLLSRFNDCSRTGFGDRSAFPLSSRGDAAQAVRAGTESLKQTLENPVFGVTSC